MFIHIQIPSYMGTRVRVLTDILFKVLNTLNKNYLSTFNICQKEDRPRSIRQSGPYQGQLPLPNSKKPLQVPVSQAWASKMWCQPDL